MSFPRYPKYKPSGVEWLGNVPAHWEVRRLKHVASHNDEVLDESTDADFEIEYVDISNVEAGRGIVAFDAVRFGTAPSRARRVVRDGDVIVSTVRTYLRAVAAIRKPPQNLVVSTGFAVVRPGPELDQGYLGFLLSAGYFIDSVISRSTGVSYPAINASELVSISAPFPPLPEQRAIAAFLDRETAKIDGLVDEQRRLIELLKEKRQAVISHAVTKGLDPKAPMKPSGVEWLGEIPEHWALGPLKRYWDLTDCKHITAPFVGEGVPVISIREVQGRWVDPTAANRTTEDVADLLEEGGRRLMPGDLVFSRNATVGEVAQVPSCASRYVMGQDVVLLRRRESAASSDFMQQVIRSSVVTQQLSLMMVGSTFKRVNVDQLRQLLVPWPAHEEQRHIAVFVLSCLDRMHELHEAAESAITLLQERRSALISAAVTGQIDVRNAATTEAA